MPAIRVSNSLCLISEPRVVVALREELVVSVATICFFPPRARLKNSSKGEKKMKKSLKTKSTGPRSAAGKSRASRNARVHGLFATELRLSKEEVPEFNRLRSELKADLKPNTALEKFVFADVVACGWKMKLSLRHEQMSISKSCGTNVEATTCAESPYSSMMWSRRNRLKFIGDLSNQVCNGAVISRSPELQSQITEVLGEHMCRILTEWKSDNPVASALAHAMVAKSENFNIDLPTAYGEIKGERDPLTTGLYRQMIGKLLDQEARNLLRDVEEGETPEDEVRRADLFIRYNVTIRRSFYQALREFRELKKKKRTALPSKVSE